MDDFVKTFVTPFLVLIGWIVVNNQNNKRETRKEFRSLVDTAKVEARTIAKLGKVCETSGRPRLARALTVGEDIGHDAIELRL